MPPITDDPTGKKGFETYINEYILTNYPFGQMGSCTSKVQKGAIHQEWLPEEKTKLRPTHAEDSVLQFALDLTTISAEYLTKKVTGLDLPSSSYQEREIDATYTVVNCTRYTLWVTFSLWWEPPNPRYCPPLKPSTWDVPMFSTGWQCKDGAEEHVKFLVGAVLKDKAKALWEYRGLWQKMVEAIGRKHANVDPKDIK